MERVILKRTFGYNQDQLEILKRNEQKLADQEQEEANRIASSVMAESSISDGERLIAKLAGQPTNEHLERLRAITQIRTWLCQHQGNRNTASGT